MRILGIDIDEVCADFIGGFNARASRVLDQDFTEREWPHWSIHTSLGITPREVERVWADIEEHGQFWEYLRPLPGVLAAFNVLERWITRREAEVVFITSRPQDGTAHLRKLTSRWLRSWGISDPYVILTDDKPRVVTALGVTHFIDDKYSNVVGVATACTGTRAYIVPGRYNRKDILKTPRSKRTFTPIAGLPAFVELVAQGLDTDTSHAEVWQQYEAAWSVQEVAAG